MFFVNVVSKISIIASFKFLFPNSTQFFGHGEVKKFSRVGVLPLVFGINLLIN